MNIKILMFSIVAAVMFSGCSIEEPIDEVTTCEDMGIVLDLSGHEYALRNSNCNIKTDVGIFRLIDQEVCREIFLNKSIFKCKSNYDWRYRWIQYNSEAEQ